MESYNSNSTVHMNDLKQHLYNGEVATGIFLLSSNSMISESCAVIPGVDWVIVDMEASTASKEDLMHIYQSLKNTNASPMVRVSELNKHQIEFALDIGSEAILIPKISTRDEAEEVARCSYYPPLGERGINPVRISNYFQNIQNYLIKANEQITVMVQIESKEAVENADEIAQTSGIDVLFIGCGDLASSYGQPGKVEGERMDSARARVLKACLKNNKIPGIFAYSLDLAKQYIQEGFKFIAIGNEIKLLQESLYRYSNEIESIKRNTKA